MSRTNVVGGIGGIAFAVLTFVAFLLAAPPGGTYKESDVADYVEKGHRGAVFVSFYLLLLGVLGLICLLAHLRQRLGADDRGLRTIFWGTGLAGAASFAIGWAVVVTVPLAMAFGGSDVSVEPTVTYTIAEAGWGILIGVGGILLGFCLIALMLGSGTMLPAWLRSATLIGGVAGLASLAFFPFFLIFIWGLVVGVWLLAAGRVAPPSSAEQPPGT
jgi:hypothetical protein